MISLEYHNELNPKLFNGTVLKKDVKDHLKAIAGEWIRFAHIPADLIDDIIVAGSNMNYNYGPTSDIDLHIVFDKGKLHWNADIVDDWFGAMKELWKVKHDITIKGYPVELYAQDEKEVYPQHIGIFSLVHDKWILKPQDLKVSYDKMIDNNADAYEKQVDDAIKENDSDKLENLKVLFRNLRTTGLQRSGEFSFENLLFKELRNRGVFDRMNAHSKHAYDSRFSEMKTLKSFEVVTENIEYHKKEDESQILHHISKKKHFEKFKALSHFGTANAARARATMIRGDAADNEEKVPHKFTHYAVRLKLGKIAHGSDSGEHSAHEVLHGTNHSDEKTPLFNHEEKKHHEEKMHNMKPHHASNYIAGEIRKKGYHSIAYENSEEDPGSKSYMITHHSQVRILKSKHLDHKQINLNKGHHFSSQSRGNWKLPFKPK